jgi:hypothetical protein
MTGPEKSNVCEHAIQGARRGPRNSDIQAAAIFFAAVLHAPENLELAPCMRSVDIVPCLRLADSDLSGFRSYATKVGSPIPQFEWPGKGSPQPISRG